MIAAISSAISGIQSATTRFENAAYKVALPDDAVQRDAAGQSQNQSSGRPLDRSSLLDGGDSFAGPLIEAKLAEVSYKASIAVLQVADDLSEELLDITA